MAGATRTPSVINSTVTLESSSSAMIGPGSRRSIGRIARTRVEDAVGLSGRSASADGPHRALVDLNPT
jgi:hypothetical protein